MNDTGSRPLTANEFEKIIGTLHGKFRTRNIALFTLARYSGYRIAELLSIRISDVWDGHSMRTAVTVSRENMKGKRFARSMPLHQVASEALFSWMKEAGMINSNSENRPLFQSRKGRDAMSPTAAWMILQDAAKKAGIPTARLSLHSFRKQFAVTMWTSPYIDKDMAKMSRLLGHSHFSSTIRYLQFVDGSLEAAVLSA